MEMSFIYRGFIVYSTLLNIVFTVFSVHAIARQVKGRPTLPSDCAENEYWVRDHAKSTGSWSAFCRVRSSGSNSKNYKFWASKFKYGKPKSWPFKEKTTDWQSKDVFDVLWVLERIPYHLWEDKLKGVFRMKTSKDPSNPGANWDSNIVLYNSAFQNEFYLESVIVHELAHEKFTSLNQDIHEDYARSAGWKIQIKNKSLKIYVPPKCCFVQMDGQDSIEEDFANNVEYFLVNPQALKKANLGAYSWIEKYFGPDFKLGGNGK